MISFGCPECGKKHTARDQNAGRQGFCDCGAVMVVPATGIVGQNQAAKLIGHLDLDLTERHARNMKPVEQTRTGGRTSPLTRFRFWFLKNAAAIALAVMGTGVVLLPIGCYNRYDNVVTDEGRRQQQYQFEQFDMYQRASSEYKRTGDPAWGKLSERANKATMGEIERQYPNRSLGNVLLFLGAAFVIIPLAIPMLIEELRRERKS